LIKLSGPCHEINVNAADTDDLEIVGDECTTAKGVAYIQQARFHPFGTTLIPKYDLGNGLGEFMISAADRKLTVTGSVNPNFSNLANGDTVGVLHRDGSITKHVVCSACANSILLKDSSGLPAVPERGEGFFVYPRVYVKVNRHIFISPSDHLTIKGIHLDAPSAVSLGANVANTHKNCVMSGHIRIKGTLKNERPNVVTGIYQMMNASHGEAYYTGFLGGNARLGCDTARPAFTTSTFSHCALAIRVKNGGSITTPLSDFYANLKGTDLSSRSAHTISGCHFYGNVHAINCHYDSGVSAEPEETLPEELRPPHFESNGTALFVGWNSSIRAIGSTFVNNTADLDLDGTVRTPVYVRHPVDSRGRYGSCCIIQPNPEDRGAPL